MWFYFFDNVYSLKASERHFLSPSLLNHEPVSLACVFVCVLVRH